MDVCIGNIVFSNCNLEKACTSQFLKDDQNCTSPKDECNLKSEEFTSVCFLIKLHEKPCILLLGNNKYIKQLLDEGEHDI